VTAMIAKYRILLYALSVTLLLGSWEIIALRYYQESDGNYSQRLENRNIYELPQQSLSHTLNVLYPNFADTLFLQGVTTGFQNRNFMTGCQFYNQALDTGVKHIEELFQKQTICLERIGADEETIQQTVDQWRKNFPNSRQFPYHMNFRGFQGTSSPELAAQQALKSIPYVQYNGIQAVQVANRKTGEVLFRLSGQAVNIRDIRNCLEQVGFLSHR